MRFVQEATMIEIVGPSYFRGLAVRCLTAARDCFDRCAKEEFRKLAEEFASKADELERARYPQRTEAYRDREAPPKP
jgi:hypothetical protein